MIANVSKTNTGKLLVAVLAIAMAVAGCAVLFSGEETTATSTDSDTAVTYNGANSSFADAVEAATADGAAVKTITLNADLTITDPSTSVTSWDLTGLIIETGKFCLTFEDTEVIGGTFNGEGAHGQVVALTGTTGSINGSVINLQLGDDNKIP